MKVKYQFPDITTEKFKMNIMNMNIMKCFAQT